MSKVQAPVRRSTAGTTTSAVVVPPPPVEDTFVLPLVPAKVAVPSKADRNILSRFSWGVTPELVAASTAAGGARAWLDLQMNAASIPDGAADAIDDWWPTTQDSYAKKMADHDSEAFMGYQQDFRFQRWTLMHRVVTQRQLLDVMTDFWSNMLFITAPFTKTFAWRPAFERAVRAKALTSFTEVLTTAVLHPCMLIYLDNAESTAWAPNENLGRELLELHTVGREAGYTELEVKDSMWILTGHRVHTESGGNYEYYYSAADHKRGRVQVLGFDEPNGAYNGKEMSLRYLAHLAKHPATAKRLATRLVLRFVSDEPLPALVDAVAAAYLANNTDIKATLRALVDHPDFQARTGTKVRTPVEDLINTYRTLQVKVAPPTGSEESAANAILTICSGMGQRPYDWPRPDGFPDFGETWSSASRMLTCWRVHKNTSGGSYPKIGMTYKDMTYWLPPLPARYDTVVDQMCRMILGKPASTNLVSTACLAVNVFPDEIVEEDTVLYNFRLELTLLSLLDTPDHMSR